MARKFRAADDVLKNYSCGEDQLSFDSIDSFNKYVAEYKAYGKKEAPDGTGNQN